MCATTSSAQVAFRADVGVIGYKTTCFDPVQVSCIFGLGFQFGADYDIHITKIFHLTPGLYWSFRATEIDCPVENVYGLEHLQEHFLNIPVHAKWKFDIRPEKFGMYVYVGPVFSVGMSSRSNFDLMVSAIRVEGTYDYFNGESDFKVPALSGSASDKINDMIQDELDAIGVRYSRIEARLDLGVGFVIKGHHELVSGYDFGMNNRVKGALAENNFMNVSNLYVGYRYRFGKKKQ
ncbi:MAG: outer membrane beta-barrel protein [Bacteroidales bacterium]|nr:outer membrane beta-barrel protein [Bacteroidales bacterium]